MNWKIQIISIAAIAAAGLSLAKISSAHGSGRSDWQSYRSGHHMRTTGRFRHHRKHRSIISLALRFRDELKLSKDQIKKMGGLRDNFIRRNISERAILRTLRFDLRKALKKEKVELVEVEKYVRAIAQKRGDLALDRIATIERGKTVLTSEQRKNLTALLRRHKRNHQKVRMTHKLKKHRGPSSLKCKMKEHEGPSR